jgi:hypothetical protein
MKRFGSYENGFTLKFDNGLVLSTRFGVGNYCENREPTPPRPKLEPLFSEDCEVAVWDTSATAVDVEDSKNRDWVTGWQKAVFNQEAFDDVRGWVSFTDWLKIVEWCEQKELA